MSDKAGCRHCGKKPANRPRGLCVKCYDQTGIRKQYPSESKFTTPEAKGEDRPAEPVGRSLQIYTTVAMRCFYVIGNRMCGNCERFEADSQQEAIEKARQNGWQISPAVRCRRCADAERKAK